MTHRVLQPRQLTREAFASFGEVIETTGAHCFPINQGTTIRYHDLARVETAGADAQTLINLFRGQGFEFPIAINMMERHPLGSQAFMPLQNGKWLAVVAEDIDGMPGEPTVFLVEPNEDGLRGVNYARNVWHHPLIALGESADFLVIDRGGPGENLEEYFFAQPYLVESPDP
jgi:ureidoglycolate lyase